MSSLNDLSNKLKICTVCNKELPFLEFHLKNSLTGRRQSHCKKCTNAKARIQYIKYGHNKSTVETKARQRELILRRVYGITSENYNDIFIEQGGCCAICGKHQEEFKFRLSIDHCHETGKVRGLLCHRCNGGLGCFDDNIQVVKNVIKYLEQIERE